MDGWMNGMDKYYYLTIWNSGISDHLEWFQIICIHFPNSIVIPFLKNYCKYCGHPIQCALLQLSQIKRQIWSDKNSFGETWFVLSRLVWLTGKDFPCSASIFDLFLQQQQLLWTGWWRGFAAVWSRFAGSLVYAGDCRCYRRLVIGLTQPRNAT